MGKILSEKERKLQRKLIPLNIFVCILSLVAAASLMFGQVFSVNVGKILNSEAMITFVDDAVNQVVEDSTSGSEGVVEVDYRPVVSMIVKNVFGSAEGSLNISAFNSAKVAFSSGDDKATKVMDELFFGDGALVTKLIDSIVENVAGMFKTPEGKQLIEEVVVNAIATSLVANLSEEDAAKITAQITEITQSFKGIGDAENREEAEAAVGNFVDKLGSVIGSGFDNETDGATVKDYIMNMYDDTTEQTDEKGEKFSAEAMISVAVSKNVDLGSFDLGGLFGGLIGGGEDESEPEGSAHKRIVDGEVGGTETGNGEDEGGETTPVDPENPDPVDPENPDPVDPENPGETPDEPDPDEGEQVVCTTYEELLTQMGLGEDQTEELKVTLKTALQDLIQGYTEPAANYFAYYGYIFYGMLAFIVPWLILFLFSFFHMFAKNKRFMMWYVKLYSWIPGLISLVIILAPKLFDKVVELIGASESLAESGMSDLFKAIFEGLSSTMWISGICFIVLWLVSIFWAFPIKHKIRKERKLAKMYGSYGGGPQGGAPNGGNNGGNYYNQPPYGDNRYNSTPYGNNAPYNNSIYGDNNYGSSPYGQPMYADPNDDAFDYGGFNAPYTGSFYGFDEDDF